MTSFMHFAIGAVLALLTGGTICFGQHYNQTNLVANASGTAAVTDPKLINPWGLSRGSGTPWWVANSGMGVITVYNGAGAKQGLEVTIPAAVPNQKGTPTGMIFNGSTTDFLISAGQPATFLFATLDGTIAVWNPNAGLASGAMPPSTQAVTMVKTTDGSTFTGLTSAVVNGKRYLFAANFTNERVDVYDSTFQLVKLPDGSFVDNQLPAGFAPFNVQAIGDDIVVTYALHQQGSPVETDGPGLGYVDVYSGAGQLVLRLEHGAWLNAPWGVALAPLDFGQFSHHLLIANFAGGGTTDASGWIAAYDLTTGQFKGQLEDPSGNPIAINGIWAISPGNASPNNYDPVGAPAAELYFTAGPNKGAGGLVGYLTSVSTDLVQGNNQ
jgi:uncharacterized protein (TIGR03118 family)